MHSMSLANPMQEEVMQGTLMTDVEIENLISLYSEAHCTNIFYFDVTGRSKKLCSSFAHRWISSLTNHSKRLLCCGS